MEMIPKMGESVSAISVRMGTPADGDMFFHDPLILREIKGHPCVYKMAKLGVKLRASGGGVDMKAKMDHP